VHGQGPLRGRGRGRGSGRGRSRRGRGVAGDRGGATGRAHGLAVGADGSSANVASAEAHDDSGESPAAQKSKQPRSIAFAIAFAFGENVSTD
jgi:hypothetical protein